LQAFGARRMLANKGYALAVFFEIDPLTCPLHFNVDVSARDRLKVSHNPSYSFCNSLMTASIRWTAQ